MHPGGHVEEEVKLLAKTLQSPRWSRVSHLNLAEPKAGFCAVIVELIGHGKRLQHLGGGPSEGVCSQT